MQRVLLVFVDGVGLGDQADYNPFTFASLPAIRSLLDDRVPLRTHAPFSAGRASLLPLDATLGVAGTPQSGTGQASLLTGRNAAVMNGRHFGPWVPTALRPLVRAESILARAVNAGRTVAFANAYPEELLQAASEAKPGLRLPAFIRAGPNVAAMGAGVFTRNAQDLSAGNAVASEIVNAGWRERLGHTELPVITAREAGATLARIVAVNDFTLFAHYATDDAGHSKDIARAVRALERLDEFIGGLFDALPDDTTTIIASDHGNIEDIRVGHTRNPALGIIAGPDHARFAERVDSLLHITPLIASLLDVA